MKNLKYLMLFAFASLTLFTSCKNDNDDYNSWNGVLVYAMGDITERTPQTITVLDNELDTVLITNASGLNIDAGKRVHLKGEVIDEQKNGKYKYWEIRAFDIDTILTKSPILKSKVAADSELDKKIGDDKIYLYKNPYTNKLSASTSLDKYLDITFTIPTANLGVSHFINLVVDDSEAFDGTKPLKVELRHNAFGDVGYYSAHGYVSFKIDEYMEIVRNLPGENNKLEIQIKYGDNQTYTVFWEPETVQNEKMVSPSILDNIVKAK